MPSLVPVKKLIFLARYLYILLGHHYVLVSLIALLTADFNGLHVLLKCP